MTVILEATGSEVDRLRALGDLRDVLGSAEEPRAVFADVCAIAAGVLPHDEARLVLFTPGA